MGYTEGRGLGKHEQGRVSIIEASKQRGRRGLGLQLTGLEANENAEWTMENDKVVKIVIMIIAIIIIVTVTGCVNLDWS